MKCMWGLVVLCFLCILLGLLVGQLPTTKVVGLQLNLASIG